MPTTMTGPPPPSPKYTVPAVVADEEGTGEPLLRPTTTTVLPGGVGVSIGGGLRKKAAGVKPWLLLESTGQAQVVEAGKHAIMRRTGFPARDLRILDPILSYPSTVLGRERAIVINLEHIKAIITAQEVLLLNSRDPSVTPFVEELQRRIFRHHQAFKAERFTSGSLDKLHSASSKSQAPRGMVCKMARWNQSEHKVFIITHKLVIAEGHRRGKCFSLKG